MLQKSIIFSRKIFVENNDRKLIQPDEKWLLDELESLSFINIRYAKI